MTHKKRSFFEKLTGAVKLEEEFDRMENEDEELDDRLIVSSASKSFDEEEEEEGQLTVDVYDTPAEIIIKTMVAGVKPDDLDVTITRDNVTIRGKRAEDRTVSGEDYIHRELYWGSFSRSINLPEEVDVEEAEAIEKYGLLMIRLPKLDKHKETKLKVKAS
ncbi:MAG: Hsp20/alpha crystallin family protein [Parcubacteria group bacterium]